MPHSGSHAYSMTGHSMTGLIVTHNIMRLTWSHTRSYNTDNCSSLPLTTLFVATSLPASSWPAQSCLSLRHLHNGTSEAYQYPFPNTEVITLINTLHRWQRAVWHAHQLADC